MQDAMVKNLPNSCENSNVNIQYVTDKENSIICLCYPALFPIIQWEKPRSGHSTEIRQVPHQ